MSVIDKFLDVMRLNDEDDYEFENEEYWDDEDEFEEEIEEKPKKVPRKKETKQQEVKREPKREPKEIPKEKPVSNNNSKITPINKSQRKQATMGSMEVCVFKPTRMEDELEITNTLLSGKTVLINVEGLNVEIAQRIIDFTSGSSYAMQGNLQKISNYIFLATPNGVDISGDIHNILDTLDADTSGFHF